MNTGFVFVSAKSLKSSKYIKNEKKKHFLKILTETIDYSFDGVS
jgi:hypothetical protein